MCLLWAPDSEAQRGSGISRITTLRNNKHKNKKLCRNTTTEFITFRESQKIVDNLKIEAFKFIFASLDKKKIPGLFRRLFTAKQV